MGTRTDKKAFEWQVGVWDRMSDRYLNEVDRRFVSIVDELLERASPKPGERVLDLGTGTGAVSLRSAQVVEPGGSVVGTDISTEMLARARDRARNQNLSNVEFVEGRAESIPAVDSSFDVVVASLSLMYVIDRNTAASEIARVLRPGGRFAATVWAAPEECDIVLFQQTAGSFAPPPPVSGVGPGSMADASEFLNQLSSVGIRATIDQEVHEFEFDNFELAWDILAGVTTAQLAEEVQTEAKRAVQETMWPDTDRPRRFSNTTQFIVGEHVGI